MKLERYNQKLLAVLGTIAVVALVLFVLFMGGLIINEVMRNFRFNDQPDNALIVDSDSTEIKENTEEFIRKQELTLGTPRLIDTLQSLYLIPVSQVNLKEPEQVRRRKTEVLLDLSMSKGYGYHSYSGYFNNIILYNRLADTKTPVFAEKVLLTQFEHREIDSRLYLLISGTTKDTNKNGKLDGADLQSFWLYDLQTADLKQVAFEGLSLNAYYVPHASAEILLSMSLDKDRNGEIDEYREPTIIKRLDLTSGKVDDLVDDRLRKQLQELID